jgi:hypothetical protein
MLREEITMILIIFFAFMVIWFDKCEPYIYTKAHIHELTTDLSTTVAFYLSKNAKRVDDKVTLHAFGKLKELPEAIHNSIYGFMITHENSRAMNYLNDWFKGETLYNSRYTFFIPEKYENIHKAIANAINENFNEMIVDDLISDTNSYGIKSKNSDIVLHDKDGLEHLLLTSSTIYEDMAKISMGLIRKINDDGNFYI